MQKLTDNQTHVLNVIHDQILALTLEEKSGHDIGHIERVVAMAEHLIDDEADAFLVLMGAYLHEFFDDKVQLFPVQSLDALESLWELDFEGKTDAIETLIRSIGFKGGFKAQDARSHEGDIVSDADLLDAMGAMGIARAFYYAGYKGLPFHNRALEGLQAMNYDEYRNLKRNAIAHFDEKLLHLKDRLITEKGKAVGVKRHQILLQFYTDFNDEIKGVI